MNREEMVEYFNNFCLQNNVEMTMYSYFYYLVEDFNNKSKKCSIIKIDDAIIPFYLHNKETKFRYLPFVNFKVEDNIDKYIDILAKYISFIKKNNGSKITFVPNSIVNIPKIANSFKIIKNDVSFYYDTSNYLSLEGSEKFIVRRHYNRFNNYFGKETKIVELTEEHITETRKIIEDWKDEAKERQFRLYDTTANRNWLDLSTNKDLKQLNFVAIYKDKVIAVMGFNEPFKNANRFDNFILKSQSREFRGLDRYMYVECLKKLHEKGIKYMNCAGSLGIKTLYDFKNEMLPIQVIQNYSIILK
jgi:hypothetical protein